MANDHIERLLQIIGEIQDRVEKKLERRSTAGAPGPSREEALEELRTCVEELRVVGEELKHQNEELARERYRYSDLFDFAPDAYLVTDPEGTIREANQAAVKLFHCPQNFLIGKPLAVFVADREHNAFRTRLAGLKVDAAEKVEDWRVSMQPRDGPSFHTVMTVGAIRDSVTRLTGLRWLIRAIPY
ncbi:MAG: PAS domain-containing protein [Deltaproteobacteria bacterium]|nr:PAS domain-containing protein [Deltaproteobacteria bacterium]